MWLNMLKNNLFQLSPAKVVFSVEQLPTAAKGGKQSVEDPSVGVIKSILK